MRVEDLQSKGSGWLIRLHEKGGKHHTMPCHHALRGGSQELSVPYIARAYRLSARRPAALSVVRRRAVAVGIMAPIGNHSFRATGITAYLANGGALEHAQEMAAHESPRTTKLYDRTGR